MRHWDSEIDAQIGHAFSSPVIEGSSARGRPADEDCARIGFCLPEAPLEDAQQMKTVSESVFAFRNDGNRAVRHSPHYRDSKLKLKSSQECSPGNMEQVPSRGHEASPQIGPAAGYRQCSSSKKLRGLGACAQARRICITIPFSVAGVSSFLFLSPKGGGGCRGRK